MKELIEKYFSDKLSSSEKLDLSNLLQDKENRMLFEKYVRMHYDLNITLQNTNIDEQFIELISALKRKEKPVRSLYTVWYKYAAILIGFIAITYFFINQTSNKEVISNHLIISDEDITLELENGNVKVVDVNGNEKIIDKSGNVIGTQNGNIINYEADNNVEELVYNKLSVPNGKMFQVVLSDGTKVHLNAGSTIKYPVKFIKGQERLVYLLNGEAYFDVTKDSKRPFIVNSNDMNVRVLGTEFNMSTYPEDEVISTVLVEGAVSLYENKTTFNKESAAVLNPGHRATWNKSNKSILVDQVDTSIYTAWQEGKLVFKNMPFKIIRKKLERHYNVEIINNDKKLEENTYSAVFDVETIEKVFEVLNQTYNISYEIVNNQILINPKNHKSMK